MMKGAMAAYNQPDRNDPGGAWVYNHRGNAYRRSGQYQRAVQDYNEAIRRAPKFAEPYAGRAFVYILLSKDKEAQLDIVRAVELGFESALHPARKRYPGQNILEGGTNAPKEIGLFR